MHTVRILLLSAVLGASISLKAGGPELINNPSAGIQLKIKGEKGRNGAAVAWNPTKKVYYAALAGNRSYPLETFSVEGTYLHGGIALNDMRGLWWNPKTKRLEGNCFEDGGIIHLHLTDEGYCGGGNSVLFSGGKHQPMRHSAGSYDVKRKVYVYYDEGIVYRYSAKTGELTGKLQLKLPGKQENINKYTIICTNVKTMEYGVMDWENGKVFLFNSADGKLTGTVTLPPNVTRHESFNLGYANNHVFLFDKKKRVWTGYKIFS